MNSRLTVTKIALAVSAASLIFSLATLIRTIILGRGVFMSLVLVFGTAAVVAVCALMLRMIKDENYLSVEEDEDTGESSPAPIRKNRAASPSRDQHSRIHQLFLSGNKDETANKSVHKKISLPAAGSEKSAKQAEKSDSSAKKPSPDKDIPLSDDFESELDKLIAELESESKYDLSNFK